MAEPSRDGREILEELARVAAAVGPAVAPAAHEELLRSIADAARTLLGAVACSIALVDGEELVFHVVAGEGEDAVTGLRLPAEQGIAGWVVASGQPIAVHDVAQDPRFAREVAEATGYVPSSILAMPLETEREVLGVIEALDARGGENDLEMLTVFARQAALAIEAQRSSSELAGVILEALARSAGSGDLRAGLEAVAGDLPGPDADLADLAARFAELGRLGPKERRAALRLVEEFLSYVRRPGRA